MELFRITLTKWADKLVASGKAARWNSKGIEMLYFAQSASLACLENTVHKSAVELKNNFFSLSTVQAPDDFEEISEKKLPIGWNVIDPFVTPPCRPIGDKWIRGNSSLLLRVPSVIVRGEYNFLVNPKHPHFGKLKIIDKIPFLFDKRIK